MPAHRIRLVGQEWEVAAAYRAGASIRELACDYGVSHHSIRVALAIAGQATRGKGRTTKLSGAQDAEIAAEYQSGATVEALAARYKVGNPAILRSLHRTSTQRRPPGGGSHRSRTSRLWMQGVADVVVTPPTEGQP